MTRRLNPRRAQVRVCGKNDRTMTVTSPLAPSNLPASSYRRELFIVLCRKFPMMQVAEVIGCMAATSRHPRVQPPAERTPQIKNPGARRLQGPKDSKQTDFCLQV